MHCFSPLYIPSVPYEKNNPAKLNFSKHENLSEGPAETLYISQYCCLQHLQMYTFKSGCVIKTRLKRG